MNERSLRVLEFTKIRAQLAQYCVSDMGRALCDALTPSNRLEDVLRMQQETEEAHSLLSYLGGTPMLSFSDVHASLHLAQIGSSLSPRALMEIGASLRAARAAREAIVTDRQDTPLMSANASRLSTFKDIEQAISDAIISEDEIADRASNELFQIRRKMRACNERVRERLNGMIHNPNFQKYLQDAIITMRADRYVLPVRQEYRSMVPGIVHDQSSTGATVFIEPMSVVEIGNELKQLISAEKVESDCSMDCSSPMSAKTSSKTASSVPYSAGICKPDCAISVNRPVVFSVTVLPPVFGPVMISVVKSLPNRISSGTTFCGSISGWRPRTMFSRPSRLILGMHPFICLASDALANAKSN